jgi:hypothetical protein
MDHHVQFSFRVFWFHLGLGTDQGGVARWERVPEKGLPCFRKMKRNPKGAWLHLEGIVWL